MTFEMHRFYGGRMHTAHGQCHTPRPCQKPMKKLKKKAKKEAESFSGTSNRAKQKENNKTTAVSLGVCPKIE